MVRNEYKRCYTLTLGDKCVLEGCHFPCEHDKKFVQERLANGNKGFNHKVNCAQFTNVQLIKIVLGRDVLRVSQVEVSFMLRRRIFMLQRYWLLVQ